MKAWVARHETATFLALTFGISWPLWILSGTLTRTPVRAPDLAWLVAQIGVFAPAFAGLVVAGCVAPGRGRRAMATLVAVYLPATLLGLWVATRGAESFVALDVPTTLAVTALGCWVLVWFGTGRGLVIPWPGRPARGSEIAWWSAASLFMPVVFFAIAWTLVGETAGARSSIAPMPTRDLTPGAVAAALATNLAFGGSLGEEPGWRGAWLPRLLQRHSPAVASLIIGFWWALWHAPIDLTQGFGLPGVAGLVVRQVWTAPLALLFTWVTVRAGGSLLPPLILHASLNAIPDFASGQPARYERALGLFFLLALVAAVIATMTDSRLRREPARS